MTVLQRARAFLLALGTLFAFSLAAQDVLAAEFRSAVPAGPRRIASVEGVTEYRLANGFRALLIPDASIDTITVNVTYLVGSRNEGYGESGMAHLLEHMMFRGSPAFPNVKGELQKRGARFNGTTSLDRTNYYETFAASNANLDWALALEADRMVHSRITRKDLDAEMTVVRNEFESGENSPNRILEQRVAATAYLWHNYGRSTIGARSDIENVPIERLQTFYRTYYQPDNAVLVLAGKFDEAVALKLVNKHFGRLPRPKRQIPGTYTAEPTQDGERQVVLRRTGDVQSVAALYHLPPGAHPDYAAVDVLVRVLGHTPSGRLHRALVEAGKASSVFGSERQQHDAGYAYFAAGVRAGQSIEAARDALIETIEGLAKAPVNEDEVNRARTLLVNDIEMTIADSRALALTLSETIAMGDWRIFFLHRDRLRQVKATDVQRAALHYLKSSNRTVGLFVPTQNPDRAEIPGVSDLTAVFKEYHGEARVAQGEAFDPTPDNIEARISRQTLAGGMKLALLPKKTRGATVQLQLSLHWGDEQSKFGRSAACSIASVMLSRGTQHKTREQIAAEFSRLKADVAVGGEGASIETVRDNLPAALELVAEILRQPAFPEAEFEQLRRSSLAGAESQLSDPSALSRIALQRHLNPYPSDHWLYNTTLEERIARVKAVTLEEARACYQDFYGASNSELAVVGDFDPDEVTKLAAKLFNDWKSPRPYARIPVRYQEVPAIDRVIRTPDKANAVLRAAMSLKVRDDNPDYPALVLGNYLLGSSPDARLARRIREKEGLSYSVGSYLSASSQDERGEFGAFAIHAPQNRARVEALIKEEINQALAAGFTAEEVESGKKGLLQARRNARNQDSAVAGRLLSYLVIGRTFEWDKELEKRIAALTPAEILAAMRRHVAPAQLSIVEAGDFGDAVRSARTPPQAN